ncbi:MAG: hypothetical protein Q9177_003859 [Variospora cf. flavescens]
MKRFLDAVLRIAVYNTGIGNHFGVDMTRSRVVICSVTDSLSRIALAPCNAGKTTMLSLWRGQYAGNHPDTLRPHIPIEKTRYDREDARLLRSVSFIFVQLLSILVRKRSSGNFLYWSPSQSLRSKDVTVAVASKLSYFSQHDKGL